MVSPASPPRHSREGGKPEITERLRQAALDPRLRGDDEEWGAGSIRVASLHRRFLVRLVKV
jgi:hypothetical protein